MLRQGDAQACAFSWYAAKGSSACGVGAAQSTCSPRTIVANLEGAWTTWSTRSDTVQSEHGVGRQGPPGGPSGAGSPAGPGRERGAGWRLRRTSRHTTIDPVRPPARRSDPQLEIVRRGLRVTVQPWRVLWRSCLTGSRRAMPAASRLPTSTRPPSSSTASRLSSTGPAPSSCSRSTRPCWLPPSPSPRPQGTERSSSPSEPSRRCSPWLSCAPSTTTTEQPEITCS